ncbi:phospholipid scramblase [Plakobranchus ocellatus]|uniref:Phospholipid scramblase n=1 Tax=Plakobranchus ocellatus TaxID=259542 RepID=A0AAV4CT64_9GAST|nr:phospholipid scramblase [Plakobranchus ocellatus]
MSQGAVVTNQPQFSNIGAILFEYHDVNVVLVVPLMDYPGQIPGVPAGLEFISTVDQLIIKQEVSVFELVTELEAKNKYRIMNSLNQQAYWALEESECCNRIWCGPERGFIFHIVDNNQQVSALLVGGGEGEAGGTMDCEFAFAVILLSRVRASPPASWPEEEP